MKILLTLTGPGTLYPERHLEREPAAHLVALTGSNRHVVGQFDGELPTVSLPRSAPSVSTAL
jgi:hypothetical protein